MNHIPRRASTAFVAALALAWPLAAAGPQVVGGVAAPVQAIREQIVAIDSAAAGRGAATTLPMAGVSLTGSGLIVGQVVDASSGAPVPNAVVSLGSTSLPAPVAGNPSRGGAAAPAPAGAASGGRGSAAPATILRQLADGDGRFAFRHLPRGGYSIMVTRPGYIDGAYGRLRPTGSPQPLELAEGERRNDVKVRVFKYAAITGMLREENGDPAVGVNVRAYRRTVVAGRAQLSGTTVAQTDDRGIYRLGNLMPGEYIVAVPFASSTAPGRAPSEISPEMRAAVLVSQPGVPMGAGSIVPQTDRFVLATTPSYGATLESNGAIMVTPTTYFPSALVASQAQPITIGSGEERAGVDIVLRATAATFISGRVVGPDGPGADWALTLVPTDTGDLSSDPQVATAVTDSDGAFMFLGIPAGSYVIQGMRISPQAGPRVTTTVVNGQPVVLSTTVPSPSAAQAPAQPTLWTATPVSVGAEGLRDLAVTLRRGFVVAGRVEFDGAAERPPATRLQTITIALEPADGRARGVMPGARVDGSGQFTSGGYLPGKYVVRVLNPPGGWTLKSVMLGPTDVADLPLELDARDLSGLLVTFVDRSTELQGSVRDPKGQPDNDAAVGVFPIDTRLWTNAGTSSRRLRMTRVSAGRFTFAGLPPGEYGVVAFSEEFAGEWPDARFLEQLSRSATRVTLTEGGKQSVDLSRQTVRGGLIASKNTSGMFSGPTKNTSGMFFEADTELEDFGQNSTDSQPSAPTGSEKHTRRVFEAGEPQQRDARVEPAVTPASAATISGSVIEDRSGQPVRRARVSVRAADARFDRAVMTDDSGRFVVSSLPPGRYSIIVTKPSFIAGYHGSKRPGRGPGTAVAVTAGQKAQVSITMARGAAITGIVRDESGAPLPNARVTAGIIRVQNGNRDIYQLGSAQTDDRGAYRIFGLAANNYYVFATPSVSTLDVRQLTSDDWQAVTNELRQTGAPAPATATPRTAAGRPVSYAAFFYPGTLSFNDATPIPVATGQEVTSIDLTARLVPTARIEGTLTAADGRPIQGALVMVLPESLATGLTTTITTQQEGRFASQYLPPGRYTLYARASQNVVAHDHPVEVMPVAPVIRSFPAVPAGVPPPPPPPPPPMPNQGNLYAEQTFDVAGENITGVSIVVQEGVVVSGRVQFEGSRTIAPGEVFPVRVSMTNAVPTRFSFSSASTSSSIGAPFTIPGVPPGKMRFAGQGISNQPGPNQPAVPQVASWMLKSAILNGRDVLDLPLEVSLGRSIDGVVLTFTDRMAELSGSVLDAAGATNADLYVMLLPADRAYWAAPTSRRFRAPVTAGLDGRYRFPNLPSGDYLLVALGDIDGLDTTDPSVLEQLAAGGIKITIADGEKKTQDIRTR